MSIVLTEDRGATRHVPHEFRRPILDTWNLLEEMAKPTICSWCVR